MKRIEITSISLMTFALFLGAGNLIFPPLMAQQAGDNWLLATAGFLVTAVGIPTFAIIVLGRFSSMNELGAGLPRWMERAFWIAALLTLGPAFVLPRAVTVAYEMSVKPYVGGDYLLPFTLAFCAVALFFALKPSKIVDYIGKYMTPAMIVLLTALVIAALINPMGTSMEAVDAYAIKPMTNGFVQGYMTLDGVASVAFGWVIISAIRSKGVNKQEDIKKYSKIVAVTYAVLMSLCYLSMGYLGATSSSIAMGATNGGEILALYAAAEFGGLGKLVLAVLAILTCLSTVIGLTNSNCQYYRETFKVPSRLTTLIVIGLTAITSNFGLETIIEVSLPAILILCPIAVTLIAASAFIPNAKTHSTVVIIATLFGGVDTLNILGLIEKDSLLASLPFYDAHMSWLLPVVITIGFNKYQSRRAMLLAN